MQFTVESRVAYDYAEMLRLIRLHRVKSHSRPDVFLMDRKAYDEIADQVVTAKDVGMASTSTLNSIYGIRFEVCESPNEMSIRKWELIAAGQRVVTVQT